MAMDFFDSQETARRKTGLLVVLFGLAVVAIMTMIYFVIAAALGYVGRDPNTGAWDMAAFWQPRLLLWVVPATLLVVGMGSLTKIVQLRAGGSAVAEQLGGLPLVPGTADVVERRVLNVVEEMAIASGTPVPQVYLLADEDGINAFAAGFSPNDAVIGITRGCAERLTRDQLQGVIAHEFSHILNGDMRMNIRLIGVVHGILVIGMIGYFVLRVTLYSGAGRSRSRSSGDRQGGNPLPLLAIGAGLMVVGFVGTFFGNLIKAAVSRQREFLADASAVQFTRNPDGIANALKKIGGFDKHATVEHPNAPEASHLFFGEAITSGFSSIFATHPPLPDRIRRIDPTWDGSLLDAPPVVERESEPESAAMAAAAGLHGGRAPARRSARSGARAESKGRPRGTTGDKPAEATDTPPTGARHGIGKASPAHLREAARRMRRLPQPVTEAAREPYGARAVVYALLINRQTPARQVQLDTLQREADKGVFEQTRRLLPQIERLDPQLRLPLVDLSLAALRQLSPAQYQVFKRILVVLVNADNRVDLFEWTLQRIVLRHLEPTFSKIRPARVRYYGLQRLTEPCAVLLSTLARIGQRDPRAIQLAFEQGAVHLGGGPLELLAVERCGLAEVGSALEELSATAPRLKRQIVAACAACIEADGQCTIEEAELFRAVCDSLGCPVPPLLPGQSLL